MKQLALPSYAHFTGSLAERTSNDDRVIIWIYGGLIAMSFIAGCLGTIAATIYSLMVMFLAVYFYAKWRRNPDYAVWGYDFQQTFYRPRDNPRKKQGKYIHALAELLFICMGLQREAGLIDARFKYDNRAFFGMLVPCILVSFLLAQINAMGFRATLETAVNTRQMVPLETFLLTANVAFATFGFFMIIGAGGAWIYYQMNVMLDYWNWRESQN